MTKRQALTLYRRAVSDDVDEKDAQLVEDIRREMDEVVSAPSARAGALAIDWWTDDDRGTISLSRRIRAEWARMHKRLPPPDTYETVAEVVRAHIEAHEYDGLCCVGEEGCSCHKDHLAPGDCFCGDCAFGYDDPARAKVEGSKHWITPEKPEEG